MRPAVQSRQSGGQPVEHPGLGKYREAVPHAFRTTGTLPVRFLALTLPGGLLGIYDEVGITATERRLPDAGVSDADIARWLELSPRYGLRVVGPPIPETDA